MRASAKPELIDAFAVELLARRQELNLSQDEVAERSDIDRPYISRLEKKTKQPSLSILHALAEALELSFSEFAGRIDHRYVVLKRAAKKAASSSAVPKAPSATPTRRK